ncbi:hypothetical protein [Nostoc sp. TCL26-01]|uniref:hypothetical protein n=1 Tax=Nostoc sp. TCL26-01 TaxID=2576904 RepID=UPI0015B81712|nr:hypothetical protein [Nostoc sp. TCL26-01]QLE54348.1 hypothetical protein FD725_01640 [Nostoc sp. TCL26-01]
MACDYIVFIHGVNTRYEGVKPTYANKLIELIQQQLGNSHKIKPVILYWGNIGDKGDKLLLKEVQKSPVWNKLWFQRFRSQQMLEFIGDAALYVSRYKAAEVVEILTKQAMAGLKDYNPQEDRVHLVSHSLGTIILFDVLFASRWDEEGILGYEAVKETRNTIFGIEPTSKEGVRLTSIHTMGSPVALFYLMDVDDTTKERKTLQGKNINTHDITPRLEIFLDNLHRELGEKKLPWSNFIHPGDPIAYPLCTLLPQLVDGRRKYIDIQDIVTQNYSWLYFIGSLFRRTPIALIQGGDAHNSYWSNPEVAKKIAETLKITKNNSLRKDSIGELKTIN